MNLARLLKTTTEQKQDKTKTVHLSKILQSNKNFCGNVVLTYLELNAGEDKLNVK